MPTTIKSIIKSIQKTLRTSLDGSLTNFKHYNLFVKSERNKSDHV